MSKYTTATCGSRRTLSLAILLFVIIFTLPVPSNADFDRWNLQIPVPEDTWLAADLYMPDTAMVAMPVIFIQTPYNKIKYRRNGPPLETEDYAFVIMDWRGKYGSQHAAVPRPQYGVDGAIAVDWIAEQEWCNGKIGLYGGSALGQIQWLTAKEQPEHLTCIVPINHALTTHYQKYYHGGVKRLEYVETLSGFPWIPFLINRFPLQGQFWQFIEESTNNTENILVPALVVSGWWDMTPDESIHTYNALCEESPDSVRDKHKLLIGPWTHSSVGLLHQGDYVYPSAEGMAGQAAVWFFNHHLRGIGEDDEPAVTYFELGPDSFRTSEEWPPEDAEQTQLFLTADGLDLEPGNDGTDQFTYDPRTPVRTHGGRVFSRHLNPGPRDLNRLDIRDDVLRYETLPLIESVRMAGDMYVRLQVSSDRTDTDFAVFLADVYPNGTARFITDGIRRLRFREGFRMERLAEPDQVYELDIPLQSMAATFEAGHKIRLYVTSSNYPRFDRNLNNGGEMYVAGDTLVAHNTVHRTALHPSSLWVTVLDSPDIDFAGHGDEVVEPATQPSAFALNAYPNPFNAATTVSLTLPSASDLTIAVYNVTGQQVASLTDGPLNAGTHTFTFNASHLASGLYFVRATVPGELDQVMKLMLVR
jgi:uncharacterized protein